MAFIHTLFRDYKDPWGYMSAEGLLYRAAGAALNTTTTGATSFATTTPTFLVQTAAATAAADRKVLIPAELRLFQAGTVGGGAVSVLMEMDNAARYSSGGTAMDVMSTNLKNTSLPTGVSAYSTAGGAITATDAVGVRMAGYLLGQDVSPAEGAVNEIVWQPQAGPDLLIPTASVGASWLINTFAGTTGPTWFWAIKFAVVPHAWLT